MFGFYLKKAFFDGWDNLIQLILQNFIYVSLVLLELGAVIVFGENMGLLLASTALLVLLFCLSMGGTSAAVFNWSEYRSDTWHAYAKGIGRNIRHSLLFFGVIMALMVVVLLVIPFYLAIDNFVGLLLGMLMVWLVILTVLVLPYYFPLMNLLPGDGPLKTLKKCFLIAGDNMGYTLLMALHNVVDLIFTLVTMGLITGFSGLMLGGQDMMKLLMKKYDWMEENPGKKKKDIDWSEIIYEEKETLGPRSLKNMIFPWK